VRRCCAAIWSSADLVPSGAVKWMRSIYVVDNDAHDCTRQDLFCDAAKIVRKPSTSLVSRLSTRAQNPSVVKESLTTEFALAPTPGSRQIHCGSSPSI
jgi:hypothetical protein